MIPIPIGTDYRMRIKPWINYGLIAVNVLLFVAGYNGSSTRNELLVSRLLLQPDAPELYQFFSCMFLHGNWSHLLGNMVFLWVFGNALNDRLGHVSYFLFYIAGGLVAGLGYLLITPDAPVLGASGAISAVTGAYLVLFPRVYVTVLLWFIFITTFQVTSLFLLGLQIVLDFIRLGQQLQWKVSGVAYAAHSSGYVFGIAVAAGMLTLKLLPRDGYDLLHMIRHGYRRTKYRRAVRGGYDPFDRQPLRRKALPKHVDAHLVGVVSRDDTETGQEIQLRRDIAAAVTRGDLPAAAELYQQILHINEKIVLPRQQQLDIANHLMTAESYPQAAEAYERFRQHFKTYEHMGDIELMLGLIYGRYLGRHSEAAELLRNASERLTDPRKKQLAEADLKAVLEKLGPLP